jgi:radical SAM protein with 4Fe4S-binding SPASM domain
MEQISPDSVLYARRMFLKKEKDFYIILNSDRPNITVVDDLGKRIVELCNGKNRISDIAERVISESQSPDTTKEQVVKFVLSLVDAGFLSTLPESPGKEIKRNLTLGRAYLHLTHGCNLRCKHCHIMAGIPREKEMSSERVLTLIEELAEIGVTKLIVTGGEPFVRRELVHRVIERAEGCDIEVGLETNGTLITDEDANLLSKSKTKVNVSLDGANAESNDFVRGAGAFGKSINGIELLVKAGVYTGIGMTLMHHNFREAEAMVHLAKKLGVNQVTMNTVFMKGRAKENQDLDVFLDDIIPIVKKAWKMAKDEGLRTNVDEFLSQMMNGAVKYWCGLGTNTVGIDADGNVYPCNFFIGESSLKIGNVYGTSIREVLESSSLVKEFRSLTVFDTECRDCELSLICAGCPAESFEFRGDLKKRTPFCSLRREIIWDVLTDAAREMWQTA